MDDSPDFATLHSGYLLLAVLEVTAIMVYFLYRVYFRIRLISVRRSRIEEVALYES